MSDPKGISAHPLGGCKSVNMAVKCRILIYTDPSLVPFLMPPLQDLNFSIAFITFAQFISLPLDSHWKAVEHILHYLKGTPHNVCFFNLGSTKNLSTLCIL